ncbi:MAG: hypothetical protein RIT81_46400 [Deltaproteobacteria bacterium]
MRMFARMFMSPAQRALKDSDAFRTPQSRDALLQEIQTYGYDHERLAWVTRSAQDIGSGPNLTIREVEQAADRSAYARDTNREPAYHNFAIASALGDDGLLQLMIQRANRIADGIQPGAKAMLSDAF